MATELEVARSAVEKGAEKPPSKIMAGISTAPRAATVAGPEPEIAPKKQETITQTIAIPPLLWPTQVFTNLIRRLEIPAFAIIFPESTKNGMARSRNLLMPEYILVATMVSSVPEYKMAQTEESPRHIEMGIPIKRKIKNVIKRIALIIVFALLCFLCTVSDKILNKMQNHTCRTNGHKRPENPFRPV